MKIVEPTSRRSRKTAVQEIAAEIDKAIPDDERVIALDRVLANIDKSQIVPRNVEGVKADPPGHLLQQDTRSDRESRWRTHLESDQGATI